MAVRFWSKPRLDALLGVTALLAAVAALYGIALRAQPTPTIPASEELRYSILWPSGLSIGTAEFEARWIDPGWRFEMVLRASLPKIEIDDRFRSRTSDDLCALEFEKFISHGEKRASESLRFQGGAVQRTNLERADVERPGTAPALDCARDALAYLYALRMELAAGRIPPPGVVHFGASYRIELQHAETRRLVHDGSRQLTDEILIAVQGPASEHSFSVYFSREEHRLPLLFRARLGDEEFLMRLEE